MTVRDILCAFLFIFFHHVLFQNIMIQIYCAILLKFIPNFRSTQPDQVLVKYSVMRSFTSATFLNGIGSSRPSIRITD